MFRPDHVNQYQDMHERADRVRAMIHARAIAAYCAAFGVRSGPGSHLDMCVIHNSLLAHEQGQPWPEVNYSKMRLAARLCEHSFEPARIVSRWFQRKSHEVRS